ncbi:acyl-CoA thioesterase [Macrococcus equipercicus]|uniref:Acyl-CoA thioesterase n=1 Tax=Macrococcus equipercicus TaxID=69967 RepID=A0A9Q9F136_9STAP|nr:acyl-CoA thioesterase [Macrococcus equipercicus]KAA1037677.1 acyl-CoA thioesterase [Macrococcus equipercicus]UTH13390.1 acyl-CoA thioesterase [Macrococcus equipercicus]
MTERQRKSMSESRTIKTQQVFPTDTNHHNTLFGGRLMAMIDDVAAIAATRHCGRSVVTASTDSVDFIKPIRPGEIVSLVSLVTYTGNSSLEVCVKIIAENVLEQTKQLAAISFLTFVALDENNKPVQVPEVYGETEDQVWLNETGKERAQKRKERVTQSKELLNFFATKLYV